MTLLLLQTALAGSPPPEPAAAVEAFVNAGDTRDVTRLEAVLHPDFRVLAQMPDGLSVMDRATYLQLITAGTIGGSPRSRDLDVVMLSGDLATVKGTLDSTAAHFDCTWTLARSAGGWQVVQDAVVYVPKGK